MWLREMTAADVAAVAVLERSCFSDAWSEKLLSEMLSSGMDGAFVLEDGGSIIGFVNPRVNAPEGELMRIAVMPAYRGKGLSNLLMKRAMLYFSQHGAKDVTLEVRTGNTPAVALYESFGFRREGLRKGYYRDPVDDAAIYWKRNTEG